MITGTISSTDNDFYTSYDSFGDEESPAILLIHGLGTHRMGWPDKFCYLLAQSGFYVVRFDNRDIGDGKQYTHLGKPNLVRASLLSSLRLNVVSPYTLREMASDVEMVMDKLGIVSALLVGASMGGMIAQHFAERFPERVTGLVLMMSTSGRRGLPKPSSTISKYLRKRPKSKNAEALKEYEIKLRSLLSSDADKERVSIREFVDSGFLSGCPGGDGIARQYVAILSDASREKILRNIETPTLVIHGGKDPLLPLECGLDLCRLIPFSSFKKYDDLSHDIPSMYHSMIAKDISLHFRESIGNI